MSNHTHKLPTKFSKTAFQFSVAVFYSVLYNNIILIQHIIGVNWNLYFTRISHATYGHHWQYGFRVNIMLIYNNDNMSDPMYKIQWA